ncbi:hypothetical protein TcWFU_001185 [Taenia crassiceps]|uniref:Palmitoyltransferase n=1 Tax=Taenia crassiceps TaxID=6207 RepID=A0ABR4QNT2_9CEST
MTFSAVVVAAAMLAATVISQRPLSLSSPLLGPTPSFYSPSATPTNHPQPTRPFTQFSAIVGGPEDTRYTVIGCNRLKGVWWKFLRLACTCILEAIFARPIRPPPEFNLSAADWDRINSAMEEMDRNRILESIIMSRGLPIETTNDVGMIRVCPTCSLIKPDRCHHCSTCECCLLKMDHHCPWIDNCVGFHNYKYFVVFLLWGFLYCLYIVCTTVVYFIDFWENLQEMPPARYNFLFLFFIAIMFGFAQSILLFYHFYLLSHNRTTLEGFRSPTFRGSGVDKRGFDLGWLQNWKEVFGDNAGLALVPVFTSRGNGYQWRRRGHKGFSYQSLE